MKLLPIDSDMDDFLRAFKERCDERDMALRTGSESVYQGVQVRSTTLPPMRRVVQDAPRLKEDDHVPDCEGVQNCCMWHAPYDNGTGPTPVYPTNDLPAKLYVGGNPILSGPPWTLLNYISGYTFQDVAGDVFLEGLIAAPNLWLLTVQSPPATNVDGYPDLLDSHCLTFVGQAAVPSINTYWVYDTLNCIYNQTQGWCANDHYTINFGSGVTLNVHRSVEPGYGQPGSCLWLGTNGQGSYAQVQQVGFGVTAESGGVLRLLWQVRAQFAGTNVGSLGSTKYPVTVGGYKDYTSGSDNGSAPNQGSGLYELDSTGIQPVVT